MIYCIVRNLNETKMYSLAIYYRYFNPTMEFYLSTRHFCINRFKTGAYGLIQYLPVL